MSLLEVEGLSIAFVQYDVGLRRRRLEVVTELDLTAEVGELVAVVGSSGSGKSLLAHTLLDLLPPNAEEAGTVRFDGRPLDRARRRALRGREIALIPQTVSALDPMDRVGRQTARAAALAGAPNPGSVARHAYQRLELDEAVLRDYPHELSGGMARRVLTATGTAGTPRLVLADEPTPGLHPELVAETLTGLRRLADGGTAVVLITHDLLGALEVADRVAVFYAGTTAELAPASSFSGDGAALRHPYSRALWAALPQQGFTPLAGAQPPPTDLPRGCLFGPRCPEVREECLPSRPRARWVDASLVRCVRA